MEKFLENIVVSFIGFVKGSPKKLFVMFFTPVLILTTLNFVDFFFIPTELISDEIIDRNKIYEPYGTNGKLVGIKYKTEQGFSFTTSKVFIPENDIDLEHTKIFNTVTFVDSDRRDYTDSLSSNLNGILKYFHFIFIISLVVGLGIFISGKQISKNASLNILIFNSIMFCVLLYMLILN